MHTYFPHKDLLAAPPVKRAAYSDRTAWIMAELSRLVYERLPNEQELNELIQMVFNAIADGKEDSKVRGLIQDALSEQKAPQPSATAKILNDVDIELVSSHSIGGTEVMCVKLPPVGEVGFAGMFVIVFRGTEPTSLADLRADLKANLVEAPEGGKVHNGFLEAYRKVENELREDLKKAEGLPVYITGHSLGGALALVATRYLADDSVGATYTFGGPRVGNDAFFSKIKTPVYRIVNQADGVARIPFGAGLSLVLPLIRLIPFNGTKRLSEWIRRNFYGYTHHGSMMLLDRSSTKGTNVDEGNVKLHWSPTIFTIAKATVPRMVATWGAASMSDHKMLGYCEKLAIYAKKRMS